MLNYFSDGELFFWQDVRHALYKQKHRKIWERENGRPVGTPAAGSEVVKEGDKAADDTVSFLRRFEGHINLPKEIRP